MLAVPPAELGAVRNVLDDAGDVLSYEQLAEDVTDQLADLDTRIANQRASIERIRELYANAADVDSIVRIEAELTSRETMLEQMLATQQQVTDRVAMSTLTVDITTAPDAVEPVDDDGTGIGDALAAGWSAFAGGVFALVLGPRRGAAVRADAARRHSRRAVRAEGVAPCSPAAEPEPE